MYTAMAMTEGGVFLTQRLKFAMNQYTLKVKLTPITGRSKPSLHVTFSFSITLLPPLFIGFLAYFS